MSKTLRELTLALSTVTGDLYHISGADLLDKRITIDDISTAVRSTLKGALVADGNVTIETGGLLLARANEDVIQEIGRVKVWGAGDVAYVSHYDFATAAGAGWQQNASGDAYLNAPTGRTAGIRIANGNILTATGALITATKPITVAGNITQTAGVSNLKTINVDGNVVINNGLADGGNLVFQSLGFSDVNIDSTSGKFRIYTSGVGTGHITIFEATKNIGLNTNVDNTIDALQVAGSIYSSTNIQANTAIYAGSLTDISTRMTPGFLDVGFNRSVAGNAIVDLIGSASSETYTDYGTRLRRYAGDNGAFTIEHRGTGDFSLFNVENASIILRGSADYATFSNTAIELLKATTITGLLTANTGISTTGVMSAGSASITGALSCATINTGTGAFEIGQSVLTTSNVSFGTGTFTGALSCATINTGNGAFEIGQNLLTTSAIACATINTGHGAVECYAMNQDTETTDAVEFSGGVKTDGTTLRTKIIDIGDWNMDTTFSVEVTHGLTRADIRSMSALIRSDSGAIVILLIATDPSGSLGGTMGIGNTTITLSRATSGLFDSTAFDSTSYNRGWITIIYEA